MLALAVAVGLATAVSPFASSSPDGLERVAQDKAFARPGSCTRQATRRSPTTPSRAIENERVATGLAGFAGTLGVFALGSGLRARVPAAAGRA